MRRQAFVAAALAVAATLGSAGVAAQSVADPGSLTACTLLQAGDLDGFDFSLADPRGNAFTLTPEQSGAPDPVAVEICFYYGAGDRRQSITVTLERFTRGDGLADWVAARNGPADEAATALRRFGEVTCEAGEYIDDAHKQRHKQRFVACDRIRGGHHLSLGFERGDDGKDLPDAARAAALVEALAARLAPG